MITTLVVLAVIAGSVYLLFGLLFWAIGLPFAGMTTDGGKMGFFIAYFFFGWFLIPLVWPFLLLAATIGDKRSTRKSA